MSRPATVAQMPAAPKATSVITNQAIVRNALSKPKPKRASKKDTSSNSTLDTSRKGVSSAGSSTDGDVSGENSSSRPSTPLRRPVNSNSNATNPEKSPSKSVASRKTRAKPNTASTPLSIDDNGFSVLEDASIISSSRRSKNPASTSPKKKNANNNNNNSQTQQFDRPSSVPNADQYQRASSSNSLPQPSNSLNSSKKKSQTNQSNNSITTPSTPRFRRNKKQSNGVTLRKSSDSEPENAGGFDGRDLKEILFPDLYNKAPAPRKKMEKKGVTLRDNFPKAPKALDQDSNNDMSCFAGSSFSNTPDPSALPKPILFGKSSPKSRNSLLHESDDNSPSAQNSGSASSSAPSSPQSDNDAKEINNVNAIPSQPPFQPVAEANLNYPGFQQQQHFAQQPLPLPYPMPYGMVSPFPIPQNNNMTPLQAGPVIPGPMMHGVPPHMMGGSPAPYYFNGPDAGYYMPHPPSAGLSMGSTPVAPSDVSQNGSHSAPSTANDSMNPSGMGVPNVLLANDLKKLLNVGQ